MDLREPAFELIKRIPQIAKAIEAGTPQEKLVVRIAYEDGPRPIYVLSLFDIMNVRSVGKKTLLQLSQLAKAAQVEIHYVA